MDLISKVMGMVRGSFDQTKPVSVSPQGVQHYQKLMPDYAQLVAEGRVWRAQEATGTASVVALPTTAALFTVGNNESDDGLWYVILAVYALDTGNAAAIDKNSLACCISQLPATTGGTDPTLAQDIAKTSIKNMLGGRGGAYSGRAILDTGVSITDDLWFPLASGTTTAVASGVGGSLFAFVNGLVVLPPKSILGTVTTATSTSNVTRKGVIWAEVPRSYLLPTL